MPTRRTFLVAGLVGGAALTAAGWFAAVLRRPDASIGGLAPAARPIVRAIVPAMLGSALPQGSERKIAIDETVDGVARAVEGLPPAARAELGQLFALLALAPARRAFAGVAPPWEEATPDEVSAFLDAWSASGWELKRSAYDALHQLVLAAWYGNPRAWPAIGYDGPPNLGG
jgi:hypothetical protein